MFRFRKNKSKNKPTRRFTGLPPRRGKKRNRSEESARRSANKRIRKLTNSGYRKAVSKPANHMTDSEWRKFETKLAKADYDVQTVIEPGVWVGESPREWMMIKRRK
mgnify:FL=1|tara:strand:+ start:1049 stop:1366 length:318 start_codon:yes stop_codon:yes gene_type:complete